MIGQADISGWLPSAEQLELFSPAIALTTTIVLVLIASMVIGRHTRPIAWLSLAGIVVTFFFNLHVFQQLDPGGARGMEPSATGVMMVADSLTVGFNMVLLVFLVCVTALWGIGSAERERNAPEFFGLLLGSALGMMLMVSTLNLLMIIIAIETASLPSYAIVAFDKRSRKGAEASMKYAIFGSISAAIMLYGASLLYGLFGTVDLVEMAPVMLQQFHSGTNVITISFALFAFLVGIGFKISAVPFHFWCPDVFEGAKIEVTTWLSVVSKLAGICLLLRITSTLASQAARMGLDEGGFVTALTVVIGAFGALTCLVGNLSAYRQTSVKRMLAYSSIAHAGYMLMLGGILLTPAHAGKAWLALLAYMFMYMFMNLGAFGATALVVWQTGSDSIENFNGLGRRCWPLALGMAVCLFSLIGMPPLGGFLAKWWLLLALGSYGNWVWGLVVWLCLNTLFSLFYYMRIVKHMYLVDDGRPQLAAPLRGLLIVNACAVVLLLTGTLFAELTKNQANRLATGVFKTDSIAAAQPAPSEGNGS